MKFLIHPAVDPERLDALKAAAPGAEWVNASTVDEAVVGHPGGGRVPGEDHARPSGPCRPVALGAGVHGEPGALHVPGAGAAPLRTHEHAGAVRGRDRRPGDGVCDLFRPEPAHLHAAADRSPVRAPRRRGAAGEQRGGARDRERAGPGHDLPAEGHDGHRRHGGDRGRDRPAGPGVRDDGPGRRPVPGPGPGARGRRPGRGDRPAGASSWPGATSS